MKTYIETFTAASTKVFYVQGRYYTTISCTNPINVRFFKGGQLLSLGSINGLLAGLEVQEEFDQIEVETTAADTVTFGVGNGNARYNRGAASVSITQNRIPKLSTVTQAAFAVTVASQTLLAANAARQYLLIQNNDLGASFSINITGAAATIAAGITIGPGESYEPIAVPVGAITIIGSAASALCTVIEGA